MGISTFLDGQAPSQVRGLLWLSLSDLGQRGTATLTDDSGGGGQASWTYGSSIPCRIDPINKHGRSRVTGGAVDERSTHLVTLPDGTTIATADRFAITGRGTFEVTAVRQRTRQAAQIFEVMSIS